MKKLLLFLTLLIVGMSANAQFSPSNNLNYIKLLKNPPIGTKADSVMVFNGADKFVKMIPKSEVTEGKEDITNKTSVIIGYSETLYPNEKATHDGLDLKLNISDLPTNLTLYPTTAVSDVAGYVKMVTDIHDIDYNTVAVDVSTPLITTTNQLISQRISAAGVLIGQPGVFNITTFGNIRHLSGSGTASFYFEVYQRTAAGVETLICTSSNSLPVTNGGYSEFSASGVWDDGTFLATDRIVIKSYANRIAGGSDPVYQFQFGGVSPVRTILPVPFSVVDAGYELSANKVSTLTASDILYPNNNAVIAGLATKQNTLTNPITGTGTVNYIPKFTGATTQGNSMLSDVSGEVSLNQTNSTTGFKIKGFNNPAENLSMYVSIGGTSNIVSTRTLMLASGNANSIYLRPANFSNIYINDLNISPIIIGLAGAPTLFNTAVTNGVDKVQVNGTISASPATLSNQLTTFGQVFTSPTFTGVPSVPTATAGTNTTQIASTAFVQANVNANAVLLTGNQTLSGVKTIDRTNVNLSSFRMFNNSSTSIAIENNNSDGIFRQSVNSSTGTHNRLYNESSGVANSNKNSSTGKFNINLNDVNTGIFNDDSNTGSGIFNKNTNSGTGIFNDSYNIGTGFFDKRRNDSTGVLNYYDSNAGSTGDLQQYLKAGVVTAKINYLGELTSPKITMTGTIKMAEYTVATLPTPTGTAYATVTDALAPSYMVTIVGGGTVVTPVFYDGTVWRSTINSDSVSLTGNQTLTGIKTFTDSVNIIDDFEPTINFTNNSFSGYLRLNADSFELSKKVYSPSFIKTGGTSSQFLKADGSVDESDVVRNIAKDATQGANITGTVSETILYSKLIPANTFKDGDFMTLFSRVGKIGIDGTLAFRARINTTNTLSGSAIIAQNILSNSNLQGSLRRIFTINSGFIKGANPYVNLQNDDTNSNTEISSTQFDPAIDNYIFIVGQLGLSTNTMYHLGTKITN